MGRRTSSVFGPIPGTRRRSSTDVNAFCVLAAMMFCAFFGPMPGSCWSSANEAVLTSIGPWSAMAFLPSWRHAVLAFPQQPGALATWGRELREEPPPGRSN